MPVAVDTSRHFHAGETLTPNEMALLALSVGFPREEVPRAAGIGGAESAGRTDVTSKNPDGNLNVGLMQIDQATARGVGRSGNVATLQDPVYNMRTAYLIWKRSGWNPWETYHTGAYIPWMNKVDGVWGPKLTGKNNPDPFGSGGAVDHAAGSVANAASAVPEFLGKLGVIFTGGFWLRVLMGVSGLALILLGGIMAVRGVAIGTAAKALRPKFN